MEKKKMRQIVLLLFLISAVIYILQILIFRDPRNTVFYIFQDFAFMPATIAIATLVVGELMNEQERQSRMKKTRMLTSTFFTELGTKLVKVLISAAEPEQELHEILTMQCRCEKDLQLQKERINSLKIRVNLTEEVYRQSMELIRGARTALMVLSSNPMLFEHEEFTDLLWALFHLIDEYNLRGEYEALEDRDVKHLNSDYTETLRLLLINYVSNAKYIRETYPNLYRTAKKKLQDLT